MNGGPGISAGVWGAVAGAIVGAGVSMWGPSKSEFVTVREYAEFKDALSKADIAREREAIGAKSSEDYRFTVLEKEISDLRVGIEGIQKRFDGLSSQIDDRFDALGISSPKRKPKR